MKTREWSNLLARDRALPAEGYRALLDDMDEASVECLHGLAREVSQQSFGRGVYVRGLIEITNRCRNNCYYCGIRAANKDVSRYSLTQDEILECCKSGYELGFRTFVLQGGENLSNDITWLEQLVQRIRGEYADVAITLSLGEFSYEDYKRLYDAGANRYLLRHESHNAQHYSTLHPDNMSLENRLRALDDLKKIGYQVGTGIMVGTPAQTVDHIVEDIEYIERFKPEMIGIGPFVPHHATPFAEHPAGSVERTLRLISIFRLMHPTALIPSTTALATLSTSGRERGILAGANVVMPNVTPVSQRKDYTLYDNKASMGAESIEGLRTLSESLAKIGYSINFDRGDYKNR